MVSHCNILNPMSVNCSEASNISIHHWWCKNLTHLNIPTISVLHYLEGKEKVKNRPHMNKKINTKTNLEFWIKQFRINIIYIMYLHVKIKLLFVHMYTWFELEVVGMIGSARRAFRSTFRLRCQVRGSKLERVKAKWARLTDGQVTNPPKGYLSWNVLDQNELNNKLKLLNTYMHSCLKFQNAHAFNTTSLNFQFRLFM